MDFACLLMLICLIMAVFPRLPWISTKWQITKIDCTEDKELVITATRPRSESGLEARSGTVTTLDYKAGRPLVKITTRAVEHGGVILTTKAYTGADTTTLFADIPRAEIPVPDCIIKNQFPFGMAAIGLGIIGLLLYLRRKL